MPKYTKMDIFSPAGIELLITQRELDRKKGHTTVIGFEQEDGTTQHYRIRRIHQKRCLVYAEKLDHLYTPEEVQTLENMAKQVTNEIADDKDIRHG